MKTQNTRLNKKNLSKTLGLFALMTLALSACGSSEDPSDDTIADPGYTPPATIPAPICLSIDAPIDFVATDAQIGGGKIIAGQQGPNPNSIGTVSLLTEEAPGISSTANYRRLRRQGVYADIELNIQFREQLPYNWSVLSSPPVIADIQGIVQLTSLGRSDLLQKLGRQSTETEPCISGVGFKFETTRTGYLFNGDVYFYLDGTEQGMHYRLP